MIKTNHPLRLWRQKHGLTLAQLADRVDVKVTPSHLSEIERGANKPSLDMAMAISVATGGEVRVEEFVWHQ